MNSKTADSIPNSKTSLQYTWSESSETSSVGFN